MAKNFAPLSFRTLIVTYAICVSLPVTIILGSLLYRSGVNEQEETERRILRVAQSLSDSIDRDMERGIDLLNVLSTAPSLRIGDWSAFYQQAKAALKEPNYIVLVDIAGRQLVNTYVPFGEQPAFTGDPDTLQRIVSDNSRVVSDLFTSLVVKRPVYNISIPVRTAKGEQLVLSLGLFPSTIEDIMREQRLPASWVATAWDRGNVVVARSRDHSLYVGKPAPRQFDTSRSGVFETTNLDGEQVLLASVRSAQSNWRISISVAKNAATASLREYMAWWGGAAALAVGFAVFFGLYFSSLLSRPLARVADVARSFGQGKEISIAASGIREVDEVARAFRAADERQSLLIRELSHRVKNILAVIQAVIYKTVTDSRSPKEAREQVNNRIAALARAHDLLVRTDWRGAELSDLVSAELAAFATQTDVSGPHVFLNPAAVQSFCMLLHELATNAAKYGALSRFEGKLKIGWETSQGGRSLDFRWEEINGHEINPPTRQGFGTTLLNTIFRPHEPEIRYGDKQMTFRLSLPLSEIANLQTEPTTSPTPASLHPAPLK
jgi:two-component sensor histidine kinase